MRPQSLVHYFSDFSRTLPSRALVTFFTLLSFWSRFLFFLSLLIRLISIWALRRAGAHTMPANYTAEFLRLDNVQRAKPQIIIFLNSKVLIVRVVVVLSI